jgi:hypothetical protein
MATFARISLANKIINVEVLVDSVAPTEQAGIDFLNELHKVQGSEPYFKQSFTDGTRKNAAVIGGTYDAARDAFIPIQPYLSWALDETTCRWEAPIPYPDDGGFYHWHEPTLSWIE